MKKMTMIVAAVLALAISSEAHVLWGALGGATNIVESVQFFVPDGRKGDFNTELPGNPAIGPYYPTAGEDGANPEFSAAGSVHGGSLYSGNVFTRARDFIQQRQVATGENFQSIVLWDWVVGGALSWVAMDVSSAIGCNGLTEFRLVIEKSDLYYISGIIGAGLPTIFESLRVETPANLDGYDFMPFVDGFATIGDTAEITMSGLTGVGYYADASYVGGDAYTGSRVGYFEAVPEPTTALLMAMAAGWPACFV